MKGFITRLINVGLIFAIIVGYNYVIEERIHAENIAYEEALNQAKNIEKLNSEELAKNGQVESENTDTEQVYKDGKYTGKADGFGGEIIVEVSIVDGEINDIQIVNADNEDKAYLEMARGIIKDMLEKNSLEVDTISGATFSSTGIKNATINALEGAL